jgi:Arc/MetJ family transcription regulator
MQSMRTTVDLPDDIHDITMAIARDQGATFSQTVVALLRRAVGTPGSAQVSASGRTGLEVIRLGRVVTSDDVRALDDEP